MAYYTSYLCNIVDNSVNLNVLAHLIILDGHNHIINTKRYLLGIFIGYYIFG